MEYLLSNSLITFAQPRSQLKHGSKEDCSAKFGSNLVDPEKLSSGYSVEEDSWHTRRSGRVWRNGDSSSVDALASLLRSLKPGISEVSCHPGYLRARPDAVYNFEREEEPRTLTDARLKRMVAEDGIQLINYRDYARLVGTN